MNRATSHYANLAGRELGWCIALNRWGARRHALAGFRLVSRLGDGAAWYALIASLPLWFGASAVFASLHLGAVAIINAALYRMLKRYTRRPRPFRRHCGIVAHATPLDEFSFPSGHTLHAVSLTALACWYFPILAIIWVPFALAVAASRVVLGLHYPSDVLAAAVMGVAIAGLSLAAAGALGVQHLIGAG